MSYTNYVYEFYYHTSKSGFKRGKSYISARNFSEAYSLMSKALIKLNKEMGVSEIIVIKLSLAEEEDEKNKR